MVTPQHPHLDIGAWLDLLDLRQYHGKFQINENQIFTFMWTIISNFRNVLKVPWSRGTHIFLRSGY